MCFIDLEVAQVWRESHRKARKPHICNGCRRTIKPGEQYLVHFSVLDGSTTANKCCGDCEADRAAFAKEHEGTLCTPDFLRELVQSCIDEEDGESEWGPMLERIKVRGRPPVPLRPDQPSLFSNEAKL